MDRRFLPIILIVVVTVFGAFYVLGAVYPRTFTILSYSTVSPQVSATALTSTESEVPVIITLKRPSVFSIEASAPFVIACASDFELKYNFETRNRLTTFEMVSGTLPREELARITSDPRVRGVWYDQIIRAVDVSFSSEYSADMVTIDEARAGLKLNELGDGLGVSIVVIDSGAASPQIVNYDGKWAVASGAQVDDSYGHGSCVSWIIKELSPNSKLYSIKVLDSYGMGRASDVIGALEVALREIPKPMVINMSLGMPSSFLDPVAESAGNVVLWNEGVYIFGASGNSGHGTVLSPAASGNVVAVGAVGKNLNYLDFSGGGMVGSKVKPDVCSYGVVYGPWLSEYKTVAGTSVATPMATATFARWLSSKDNPNVFNPVATSKQGVIDLGQEGEDTYYGSGFLSGEVMAQVEGVERENPQSRLILVMPLTIIALVPAVIAWKKGRR